MKRPARLVLFLCAAALAGCAGSPEATRTQGGGPGADVGNRGGSVEVHGGSKMFYRTPCRTVKVKCSGPEAVFGT